MNKLKVLYKHSLWLRALGLNETDCITLSIEDELIYQLAGPDADGSYYYYILYVLNNDWNKED